MLPVVGCAEANKRVKASEAASTGHPEGLNKRRTAGFGTTLLAPSDVGLRCDASERAGSMAAAAGKST